MSSRAQSKKKRGGPPRNLSLTVGAPPGFAFLGRLVVPGKAVEHGQEHNDEYRKHLVIHVRVVFRLMGFGVEFRYLG